MCSSRLVSNYGYQEILRPLLDDLGNLETEWIYIKFGDCIHQFYGTLTMVFADNLADHALNCLEYYHVINGLPPNIIHDILAGFVTDFLKNLLSYFISFQDSRSSECSRKLSQLLSY